jgi:hypothetical protein
LSKTFQHVNRAAIFFLLLTLVVSNDVVAFEFPLSDIAIRDAYFLGQRNDQKTSDFLKLYTHSFPLPDKGPYISEIHLLTPYAQIVSGSSRHSVGYSAQQAAADYHGRGDTLLLQVRVELTPTYTYDDAVRTANDTAAELNRQLYPEDFWQAFQFKFSQEAKTFEPRAISADPIEGTASPSDRGPTLRGTVVTLKLEAEPVESGIVQVEVTAPTGQHLITKFDLSKLR